MALEYSLGEASTSCSKLKSDGFFLSQEGNRSRV